jgi:3-methyladenine DNA glycosylase AlkD
LLRLPAGSKPTCALWERRNGRRRSGRAYLKSELTFLGASVPAIRRVTRAARAGLGELGHDDVVRLVDALWSRGIHECRMAGVELLQVEAVRLGHTDLAWLEGLIRTERTWALIDGLAVSVVGVLYERDRRVGKTLGAHRRGEPGRRLIASSDSLRTGEERVRAVSGHARI